MPSSASQIFVEDALSSGQEGAVSLAEILSALSFALDLTEGAVPGHALRSCVLGMRLAQELRLPQEQLISLYYALILKDVGCSSNAARMCQIIGGGDERTVKAGAKLEDWTRPGRPRLSAIRLLWSQVSPTAKPFRRALDIARIALTQHQNNREVIGLRCDRGASIVRKFGLGDVAAEGVRGLDEHWDGSGYPERRQGLNIPLEARILAIAQHLDVFAGKYGTQEAISVLNERSGRWFDPELVKLAGSLNRKGVLWKGALVSVSQTETRKRVLDLAPDSITRLRTEDIDVICEGFGDVVDAKSHFTFSHSMGVTVAAMTIAASMGLNAERASLIKRASLLHDLGKLRVPNSILDKPSRLQPWEWQIVKEHPGLTRQILSKIQSFGKLAMIAGAHHEKLDGSGYPDRLTASDLPLEARIIAVADVYGALTEDRPYRPGLSAEQALNIMALEVPSKLDADAFEALRNSITSGGNPLVSQDSGREVVA